MIMAMIDESVVLMIRGLSDNSYGNIVIAIVIIIITIIMVMMIMMLMIRVITMIMMIVANVIKCRIPAPRQGSNSINT